MKSRRPNLKLCFLEITTRCNYKCKHCFGYSEKKFKSAEIPYERVKEIVKDYSFITISGGEPTVHSRFDDVLKMLSNKKVVSIVTNGSHPEYVKKYRNYVWGTSVDGDETYHDANRGVNGAFSKAMEVLKEEHTYISSCVSEESFSQIPYLCSLAETLKRPITFTYKSPEVNRVTIKKWNDEIIKQNCRWLVDTQKCLDWRLRQNWFDCNCIRVDGYFSDGTIANCFNPHKNCTGCVTNCASQLVDLYKVTLRFNSLLYHQK